MSRREFIPAMLGRPRGLQRSETAAWALLALALAFLVAALSGTNWADDSYQYLSAADNLRAHGRVETSLVYFDTERAHGVIPAPLTTFPPGYPLLIAALSFTGLSLPHAALGISMLCFAGTVVLLALLGSMLQVQVGFVRLMLGLAIANEFSLRFATGILTESLYTFLSLAAVSSLLFMTSGRVQRVYRWAIFSGLLAGLCYWVRYAGLFLIASVLIYAALRRRRPAFVTAAVASSFAAALALRNISLTGGWKGGNTKAAHHDIAQVLAFSVTSIYHLLLGAAVSVRTAPFAVAALGGVLLIGFLAFRGKSAPGATGSFPLLLFLYLAVYSLGMLYLGVTSVISFGPRMFYPVFPVALLLLAGLVNTRAPRQADRLAWNTAFLAVVAAVALGNLIALRTTFTPSYERVLSAFGTTGTATGSPEALLASLPASEPLLASDAQATGYALHHPVVGLTDALYTETVWNEATVRDMMDRFRVRYLILYPQLDPGLGGVQTESPFVAGIMRGQVPQWLELAAANPAVRIYRRRTS